MPHSSDAIFKPEVLAIKGTGREPFLQRVRAALGHGTITPPAVGHPIVHESLLRQVRQDDPARLERWLKLAQANAIVTERVHDGLLLTAIDKCLANHQIKSLLLNAGVFESSHHLPDHLAGKNIQTHRWGALQCRERAFTADASITDCRYAIADSGALMVWSDAHFGRSSTLTVPVHIVLLPASRILADLIDAFTHLALDTKKQLPSNVVIINGPSKTSDIEMKLVTGVHGPKYLYVILIDTL